MTHTETPLARFFQDYARATQAKDPEALLAFFTDPFLNADPSGTTAVPLAAFRAALPRREAWFRSLGHESSTLTAFDEAPLSPEYALVHATWTMRFRRETGSPAEIHQRASYVVCLVGGTPRIATYVTHTDIRAQLAAAGIAVG